MREFKKNELTFSLSCAEYITYEHFETTVATSSVSRQDIRNPEFDCILCLKYFVEALGGVAQIDTPCLTGNNVKAVVYSLMEQSN